MQIENILLYLSERVSLNCNIYSFRIYRAEALKNKTQSGFGSVTKALPLKEMQSNLQSKVWLNREVLNYLPIIYLLPFLPSLPTPCDSES